jgi:agmatinase
MRLMRLLSTSFDPDRFAFDLVEVAPNYDVSDGNSYNGGITSGLANRLIVELLAGLSLTKKDMSEGKPVRPRFYRGKGHTYDFGNEPKANVPKRPPLNYGPKKDTN